MTQHQRSAADGRGRGNSGRSWLRTLVRTILRLYPENVWGIYRTEMEETFFDRRRRRPASQKPGIFLIKDLLSLAGFAVLERVRTRSSSRPLSGWADDVRSARRVLLRQPAFSLGAVALLALGIGVNTTVFSIFNGQARIVNRFRQPDRLVFLTKTVRGQPRRMPVEEYTAWRGQARAFEDVAAYTHSYRFLADGGEPLRLRVSHTSANLLPMLGITPEVGRLLGAGDEATSAPAVAVITYRFWQERYRGDRTVLGRTVLLNEVSHTIVGVLPAKVEFEMLWRDVSVFVPLSAHQTTAGPGRVWVDIMARLADGASVEGAQAEATVIAARLTDEPAAAGQVRAQLLPFGEFFFSSADRLAMAAGLVAVAAVLIIACVNLANLLLAKGVGRQGEVAMRMVIGATRSRVVRQLLTESLLLALLGGAGGILLGRWGLHAMLAALPSTPYLQEEIGLDPVLLGYAFGVSLLAALAFGLTPALLASRVSLGDSLKLSGAGAASGRMRTRFRSALLVGQLALTVPLTMVCAASFLGLRALQATDFGFPLQGLMSVTIDLPAFRYRDDAQKARFYRDVLASVRAVPGVRQAATGPGLPIGTGAEGTYAPLVVKGRETLDRNQRGPDGFQAVATTYFDTLGSPVRKGRLFTDQDTHNSAPVAVVNEAFARTYWPGADPLGQCLVPETDPTRIGPGYPLANAGPITVVGVVADIGASFSGDAPGPALYLAQEQFPGARTSVLVRTAGNPSDLTSTIREAVARVDADVPATAFLTAEQAVDRWLQETRVTGAMLGVMAILALGMTILGLYGMVVHSVTERTFEVALRVTLGASPSSVRFSVMRSFVTLAGVGMIVGVLISVAIAVVARSAVVLPRVSYAPMVLGVSGLLMAVVLLAAYLPARRATRIEPVLALKHQ